MTIKLYNNSAENNRVDKTDWLSNELVIGDVILKDGTSIIRPSLLLAMQNVSYNYLYIQELNRYYFIINVASIKNGLWRIDCRIDVLMTYKSIIKNNVGLITRNQFDIDPLVNDDLAQFKYVKEIKYEPIISAVPVGDVPITHFTSILADNDFSSARWIVSVASAWSIIPYGNIQYANLMPANVDYVSLMGNARLPWIDKYKTGVIDGLLYAMNKAQLAQFVAWVCSSETRRSYIKNIFSLPYNIETTNYTDVNTYQLSKEIRISQGVATDHICTFDDSVVPSVLPLKLPKYCMSVIKNADFTFHLEDEYGGTRSATFLDYTPYKTYELYCPFYGFVKLDLNDILNDRIQVWYYTSLTDGVTTLVVYNKTDNNIIFSTEVQMVTKLSIDANNRYENEQAMKGQAIASGLQLIGSLGMAIAGTMAAPITGGASASMTGISLGLTAAGTAGALNSVGQFANKVMNLHDKANTQISNPSSGIVNSLSCYLRITTNVITSSYDEGGDFEKLYGRPCMKNLQLSQCHGFTQVGEINLEGFTTATADEVSEIKNDLQAGVLFEEV